jgi:rubrerythrin
MSSDMMQNSTPETMQSQTELFIPFLPIIGMNDLSDLIKSLHQFIIGEATDIDFYSRLIKDAPNDLHREFIKHALDDEKKHLEAFKKLYKHFTGRTPQYTIKPITYNTYKEGLLIALKDELEATDKYRDVIISYTDQLVKETLFLTSTDEMGHAVRFGVLYNETK